RSRRRRALPRRRPAPPTAGGLPGVVEPVYVREGELLRLPRGHLGHVVGRHAGREVEEDELQRLLLGGQVYVGAAGGGGPEAEAAVVAGGRADVHVAVDDTPALLVRGGAERGVEAEVLGLGGLPLGHDPRLRGGVGHGHVGVVPRRRDREQVVV